MTPLPNPNPSAGIFQQALSRFQITLTEAEKIKFQCVTVDDLEAYIDALQQEQTPCEHLRNMNRIRGFVDGMKQYGEVIKVFLNSHNILAYVWVIPPKSLSL